MSYICPYCEEEFDNPIIEDEGIGFYDYGGATGRDVRMVAYAPCCDAEITDMIQNDPPDYDYDYDYEYDYYD